VYTVTVSVDVLSKQPRPNSVNVSVRFSCFQTQAKRMVKVWLQRCLREQTRAVAVILGEEMLETSGTAEHQMNCNALKRNGTTQAYGSSCDEGRDSSSPDRLWPSAMSPAVPNFSSMASPMLRFADASPGAQFQTTDYINKLLSDDPLLRSPTGEGTHLLVDTNGELVLPAGISSLPLSRSPTFGVDFHHISLAPDAQRCRSAAENGGRSGDHPHLEDDKKTREIDFALPGLPCSPGTFGEAEAKEAQRFLLASPATSGFRRIKSGNSNNRRSVIGSVDKTMAAERKRAVAVASRATAAAHAARLSHLPPMACAPKREAKTSNRKRKRATAGEKSQGSLDRLAALPGNKSLRRTNTFRGNAEAPDPGPQAQYTDEEMKRIRRVKNRASVEKCRTKQRKRMEALELELQALQQENSNLLAVTKCILSTFDTITREVFSLTGTRPLLTN
jgi:hypothetical protein